MNFQNVTFDRQDDPPKSTFEQIQTYLPDVDRLYVGCQLAVFLIATLLISHVVWLWKQCQAFHVIIAISAGFDMFKALIDLTDVAMHLIYRNKVEWEAFYFIYIGPILDAGIPWSHYCFALVALSWKRVFISRYTEMAVICIFFSDCHDFTVYSLGFATLIISVLQLVDDYSERMNRFHWAFGLLPDSVS